MNRPMEKAAISRRGRKYSAILAISDQKLFSAFYILRRIESCLRASGFDFDGNGLYSDMIFQQPELLQPLAFLIHPFRQADETLQDIGSEPIQADMLPNGREFA